MRVISGKYRRMRLKSPNGFKIRPTSDQIKETLFNMLEPHLSGAVFLDLFAGTGQIGIEALSRGAKAAVFMDRDREAISLIKENLAHIKAGEEAIVIMGNLPGNVRRAQRFNPDIIFLDPPYDDGLYEGIFAEIRDLSGLDEHTLIVCESALSEEFLFLEKYGFYIEKDKKYKSSKHTFIRKVSEDTDHE